MAVAREPIHAALFAQLKAVIGTAALHYERRFREPDEIPSSQQPAVLCYATHGTPRNDQGRPPVWTLCAQVIIYVRSTKSQTGNLSPESTLLTLIDKVEQALEAQPADRIGDPDPGFSTSLGGLVQRAWIGGTIELYQGPDTDQLGAVIPIEMLVTA